MDVIGENKHISNVQLCIHPFSTPSLFGVPPLGWEDPRFPEPAGRPASLVCLTCTNRHTYSGSSCVYTALSGKPCSKRLDFTRSDTTAKKNAGKKSLLSGDFYFNTVREVLEDLDDLCHKMSNPSMGRLWERKRFNIKLGIQQAFDQCGHSSSDAVTTTCFIILPQAFCQDPFLTSTP